MIKIILLPIKQKCYSKFSSKGKVVFIDGDR
nr:MAG TPA: hypothetical protein [Caudoviricetes sp.]